MRRVFCGLLGAAAICAAAACDERQPTSVTQPTPSGSAITSDSALFRQISQTDPLQNYAVFPSTEEFTTGRLNGSDAHRTVVRVRINAVAAAALRNGKLPAGTSFPLGSVILKEIRAASGAPISVYAVLYKDPTSAMAANGWLWAEFNPDGSSVYSINARGSACTSCHSLEQGRTNDLVRTFERQQ